MLKYKPPLVPHTPSLTYKQNNQLQTVSNQSPGLTDNKPRKTRPTHKRPIGIEQTLYLCTLCETPTKLADYHKLRRPCQPQLQLQGQVLKSHWPLYSLLSLLAR